MLPPRIPGRERTQDADAATRQTDTDAALARLSAVRKGYLTDPFVAHLVPRAQLQSPRPPLINIGTYVRSHSIDHLTGEWMEIFKQEHGQCQIVSLGSGSDTRFWRIVVRLLASLLPPSAHQSCVSRLVLTRISYECTSSSISLR